jgi:5S rRNA maturation endonuclease (ribonuclease M5)
LQIEELLSKLNNVKRGAINKEYTARCPAHDDKHNSLSIAEGDDNRILLYCHAGCSINRINDSLGIKTNDLFSEAKQSKRQIDEYIYKDLDGNIVHKTIRYEPKGFSQCRPDEKGGWIYNLQGIETIIYNLKEITAAISRDETVYIVEGEKDANTMQRLGLQATTSPMGAGKWKDYYSDYLLNATIIIIPDNDYSGKQHAELVARSLNGKARSIKIIDLKEDCPELPEKGDITDFISILGQVNGMEKLKGLCNSTPEWKYENSIYSCGGDDIMDTIDKGQDNEAGKFIPFDEYRLPVFPVQCLPNWLNSYVEAIAEDTQTPVDMAAVIGISVIASVLSKKIKIKGKQGWVEPLNLYTAVIMKPGERKSSVFAHMSSVLVDYEAEVNEILKTEISKSQTEKRILEETLKELQVKASKQGDNKAKQLALEKAEELALYKELKQLRILADDVSPEKIASLLSENGGRMAILSAEGGIFEIMAGRYSQNGTCNIDTFLKGHSGDMLRVDRIGRSSEHIKEPALTIGLAIQPDVLNGIMRNSNFRGRGLTARFLFSMPTSKIGYRNIESQPVSEEIKMMYSNCIRKLLEIDMNERANILALSHEALTLSNEFAKRLEPKLVDDLEFISDWAGKLHGAILRIAGILHISQHVLEKSPWEIIVSSDTMSKAISIGEYFVEHAKAAFNLMGTDKNIEDAKYILKWIKKQCLNQFTKRDAHRAMLSRFKKVDEIEIPLGILVEYNYITAVKELQINSAGRKPSTKYRVNTKVFNEENNTVSSVNSVS